MPTSADGWHISAPISYRGFKLGCHIFISQFCYSLQTGIWQPGIWLRAGKFSAIYILKFIWQSRWNILAEDSWLILTVVTALEMIIPDLESKFKGKKCFSCWIDWKNLASLSEPCSCGYSQGLKSRMPLDTTQETNPEILSTPCATQPKFLYCIINICSFSWHIGIPDGLSRQTQ